MASVNQFCREYIHKGIYSIPMWRASQTLVSHCLNNTYFIVFMTALSHHGSMRECLTGCNIPAKSTLPAESTHRGTPQSWSSLPIGTQGKCPEWEDNTYTLSNHPRLGICGLNHWFGLHTNLVWPRSGLLASVNGHIVQCTGKQTYTVP